MIRGVKRHPLNTALAGGGLARLRTVSARPTAAAEPHDHHRATTLCTGPIGRGLFRATPVHLAPHAAQGRPSSRSSGFASTRWSKHRTRGHTSADASTPQHVDEAWGTFLTQLRHLRRQTRHQQRARASLRQGRSGHRADLATLQTQETSTSTVPDAFSGSRLSEPAIPSTASEVVDKRLMDSLGVSDWHSLTAPPVRPRETCATPTDTEAPSRAEAPFESAVAVSTVAMDGSSEGGLAPLVDVACRAGLRTHASAVLVLHHVFDALLDGCASPSVEASSSRGREGRERASPRAPAADVGRTPRDRTTTLTDKWNTLAATLAPTAHRLFFSPSLCAALLEHQAQWMTRRVRVWQRTATAASNVSTPSSTTRQTLETFLQRESDKRHASHHVPSCADASGEVDAAIAENAHDTMRLMYFLLGADVVPTVLSAGTGLLESCLQCCRVARHPSLAKHLITAYMDALEASAHHAESAQAPPHAVDTARVLTTIELAMWAMTGEFETNYSLWLRYVHWQRERRAFGHGPTTPDGAEEGGVEAEDADADRRAAPLASQQLATAYIHLLPALTASVNGSAAQLEAVQRTFETILTDTDVAYQSDQVEAVRAALVGLLQALSRVSLEASARMTALANLFRLAQVNAVAGVTQHADVDAVCARVLAAAQQSSAALTVFNKLLAEPTRSTHAFNEGLIGAVLLCGHSAVADDIPRLLSYQTLKYPVSENIRDALVVKLLLEKEALAVRRAALKATLQQVVDAAPVDPRSEVDDEAANDAKTAREDKRTAVQQSLSETEVQIASATTSLYLLLGHQSVATSAMADRAVSHCHPSSLSQAAVHRERCFFLFVLTLYQDLHMRVTALCEDVKPLAGGVASAGAAQSASLSSAAWSVADSEAVHARLAASLPDIDADVAGSLTRELQRFLERRDPHRTASASTATLALIQSLHVSLRTRLAELTGFEWKQSTDALERALIELSPTLVIEPAAAEQATSIPASPLPLLMAHQPLIFADLVSCWSTGSLKRFMTSLCDILGDDGGSYRMRACDAHTVHQLHAYLVASSADAATPSAAAAAPTRARALQLPKIHVMDAKSELDAMYAVAEARRTASPSSSASASSSVSVVYLEDTIPHGFPSSDSPAVPRPAPTLRHTLSSTSTSVRDLYLPRVDAGHLHPATPLHNARVDVETALDHLLTYWLDVWHVEHTAAQLCATLPYAFLPTETEVADALSASTVHTSVATAATSASAFFDAHAPLLLAHHTAHLRRAQSLASSAGESAHPMPLAESEARDTADAFLGDMMDEDETGMSAQNDWALAQFEAGGDAPNDAEHEDGDVARSARGGRRARRHVKRRAAYAPVERFVDVLLR